MSLEAALAEHTSALKENTELLRVLTGKASAGVAAASASNSNKGDGAADKPTRARKAKAPSAADMKAAAEKYLDVQNEDQYATRRANLKSIVEKFGAPKFTEIPEEKRQDALDLLAEFEKNESRDVAEDDDDVV